MTYLLSEGTRTRLSNHIVAVERSDIGSILAAIKQNSSSTEPQTDEVIIDAGTVKVISKGSADEEQTSKFSDNIVAVEKLDIGSILAAIKQNSSNSGSQTDEVIIDAGTVKVVPKGSADEEKTSKFSDKIVAGYWYDDYPQVYKFEKSSLAEQRRKQGSDNFAFSEGRTSDGRLYFTVTIRLKIDEILPNYKVHKFLMVYSHNFCNQTSGTFGGQSLKVYPADPDENYYYRNGEIFHHLLPKDEENRHYICRSQTSAKESPQDVNAFNSVEEIYRWLFVFYVWKASGIDIDKP